MNQEAWKEVQRRREARREAQEVGKYWTMHPDRMPIKMGKKKPQEEKRK